MSETVAPRSGRMARAAVERSLPRAAYIDPEQFHLERDRIFYSDWFCIGREESLPEPGDFLHVDVAGEKIIVVRARTGELRAHYDLCVHRGSRLVPGAVAGASRDRAGPDGTFRGVIRCPYHSWTYELDGTLRNAPFLGESDDFDKDEFSLHPVAIESWAGFVFVDLSPEETTLPGRGLMGRLGAIPNRLERYPLRDLRVGKRLAYDVAANWKVIAENYNECYHCAGVHPELCRVVPAFKRRGGADLDWDAGIPQADGTFTFTMTGTTDRNPFPGLSSEERVRHKGELIYPNLMLSLSADHVAAFILFPVTQGRTSIVVDLLFHPDEMAKASFDPADAVDFWDLVNRQDWVVCEAVQDGMSSRRFKSGYYAPMEDMSADIRRYLAERMDGAPAHRS